jgi:ribosomal peptide maturation radical SAM protein 1
VLQRFKQICLDRIREVRPEVVGLTTSCNQLMAALWLARCIKQESPEVTTVLGGSACSEPMGTEILAAYPEVDHVVSGYGEQPLLGLARGADPAARLVENCTPVDSDAAPIPDYGPFLRELATVDVDPRLALAFQSSRGCWWGRKHHCRFCGVNGTQMGYRTKSDARVIQEIRSLWEKHGRNLFATDAILSRQHLQRVVPELSRFEEGPKIFYELKTNLTQAEVAALGRAGVVGQLGVESLNTRLLKLLDKGVSAITNVAVLKWCRERKVAVSWNLLCAIPGEQTEDYEAQIRLMQGIPHLPPPARVNPIHLCRFSPYFDEFHEYGWTDIEPRREYRVMHPHLGDDALRRIAYHFEGVGGVSAAAYQERLESAVQRWQERCRAGDGLFLDPRQGLVRNDGDVGRRFNLDGPLGRIIECTHDIAPVRRVLGHARCARSVLEQMADHGLLFIEGDRVVNLAVRTHLPDQP